MNRLDILASQFCRERPDCIRLLVRLARAEKAAGATRLSMKAIWERARPLVKAKHKRRAGAWVLNNSLTSRIARILSRSHNDLRNAFEFRALAGDRE